MFTCQIVSAGSLFVLLFIDSRIGINGFFAFSVGLLLSMSQVWSETTHTCCRSPEDRAWCIHCLQIACGSQYF